MINNIRGVKKYTIVHEMVWYTMWNDEVNENPGKEAMMY